eukprot:TRINITY_DN67994_c3_g4_i3.p3 TRINITY_DN67994_c3_g4~~TRINITY_DN67994_c3_g4_i3.p3  ORF type:complete len:301 (-),score=152.55 TRINITY_DN67994_c3_g4_i3:47-949(-)
MFMTVTDYNVAAFAMIILCSLYLLVMVSTCFACCNTQREWAILSLFGRSEMEEEELDRHLEERELATQQFNGLSKRETWALWFLLMVMVVSFWSFLAAIIPATRHQQWSILSNYLLFCFIGVVFVVTFGAYKALRIQNTNTKTLLMSIVIMAFGCIALSSFAGASATSLPTWQVLLASGLLVVGFGIGTVQLPSMYSTMISEGLHENVSGKMTMFFASLALARTIGPLWGAIAYHYSGLTLVAHTSAVILMVGLMLGFLFLTRSGLDAPRGPKSSLLANDRLGRHQQRAPSPPTTDPWNI